MTQIKLLKVKIMSEMKNIVGRINSRWALQKKKINELEDITIETSKIKRKKKIRNIQW